MATIPAGTAGGVASSITAAMPKMVSATSSVTALRVVTPGGTIASQPSALRVTPVSSGVRSAGGCQFPASCPSLCEETAVARWLTQRTLAMQTRV